MHGSGVIIREHFGSSFCHLLSVAVNILPAASLNLATTYAGSRRFCTQQQFERSITQCQCTKRMSVRPGILVAMIPPQVCWAALAPSSTLWWPLALVVCDTSVWVSVCSLPRLTSLSQLHLYLASFDFLFHPLHYTSPIPSPPAPSSQAVRLQEVGLGRPV